MLSHLTELKLTLAALVGIGAWLADTSQELNLKGWEEMGVRGILFAAVVFIGRLFLESQKAHKAETEKIWETHKAEIIATKKEHAESAASREQRLVQCLENNAKCLSELTTLTREQTDYFKAVTRNVVSEKLNGGKPTLP